MRSNGIQQLTPTVRPIAIIALVLVAAAGCGRTGGAKPAGGARAANNSAISTSRSESSRLTALAENGSADAGQKPGQPLLRRASAHLWSKQAADGGWHSEQYGLLRSGQAYTPFVLFALLNVPEEVCPRPADGVERALAFIRAQSNQAEGGVIGLVDVEVPEYPVYSTAYALRCLLRAGRERDAAMIARMRDYLLLEQFREENGFGPDAPVYGGWGFGGRRPQGSSGHMDIAHTRRALEALRAADVRDQQVYRRAESFLRYVQRHPGDKRPQPDTANEPVIAGASSSGNGPFFVEHSGPVSEPLSSGRGENGSGVGQFDLACCSPFTVPASSFDGGFYFSPVVLNANKGRVVPQSERAGPHFRSYATATCDGLLALLAAGVPLGDQRLVAARAWLANHPRWDLPEGVPEKQAEPWAESIYFYHLAVRAEAYDALGWPAGGRDELIQLLAPQQRPDGSVVNTRSHLMKEDDPLLATTLAITALSLAVK